MLSFLIFLVTLQGQSDGLLDAVNSERGGRHWIDQKPDPPRSPEESKTCFQIEPGSRIELVAAEPLVVDPVWIDFDHLGRMFAAEYSDYPIGPVKPDGTEDTSASPLSRIVLLEDTDGDGRMDRRTVFADQLKFCHSFMPLMGGILAGAQTEILFLKDTDGDNVADVREVWFDGFAPAHPQMQIGCPQWGMDNWIYLTYAPGKIRCRRPGFETETPVTMPRQDMRFDPLTMKFEPISGLGQFGNTVDREGNRFFCTNRNPIMMEIIPQAAAGRNPFVTISLRHTDVGPSGGDTKVFPLVAMKSNYLSHAGTHTSACGVTAYLGDLWNAEFQHSVFDCEPVGHLVTRSIVESQPYSPALTARRARPTADFLASSDTWFRPASLRTGPDGALYLADMYRMWVEHPKFLPPEIAARIDWRAGDDKGRIWRIVPVEDSAPQTAYTPTQSPADLVKLLHDPNGWRRQMARRLIVESQSVELADQLSALQKEVSMPWFARAEAMWAAEGIGTLDDASLIRLLNDSSDQVRMQAARLAANSGTRSDAVTRTLMQHFDDVAGVQQMVALACGDDSSSEATTALVAIAGQRQTSSWFQKIILTAAKERSNVLIEALSADAGTVPAQARASVAAFLTELSAATGLSGDPDKIASTLKAASQAPTHEIWAPTAILTGLSRSLPRHRGSQLKQKSLAGLLADPLPQMEGITDSIVQLLDDLAVCALDRSRSTNDRIAAVGLLSSQSPEALKSALDQILAPDEPVALQQAAIQAAGVSAVDAVLAKWSLLAPAVRSQSLSLLLARPATTQQLLNLMAAGTIAPSVIDIDQRMRLLQHRDEQIRKLSTEIFGGVVSANRKAVADEYQPAVTMNASAENGAAVFLKTCSKCHKVDGKGHNVGPDISDTRNRSRDALLYDILDPNRRVDPQYSEYIVVTTDGRLFNGLLVSDTGQQIVLRQPEGKEQIIGRSEIEEFQATQKSLMPEGVEKDVSVQQMADLLEFLKAR